MSTITLQKRPVSRSGMGWHVAQLLLNALVVIAMVVFIWAALVYARAAANLAGDEQLAQRIFYIHMGCNFAALAGFLMSIIGSVIYLLTRNLDWDRVTQSSIEVGTIFGSGVLLTGMAWMQPTWNTTWTWDPRLTTTVITVLIYIAYMLFRNGIDNRQTRALFGSIYALVAFLSVPLTYYSTRWFRSIHPVVWDGSNSEAQGDFGIGATMSQTLMVAVVSFSLLFSALMIARWRQLRLEDRIADLQEAIE